MTMMMVVMMVVVVMMMELLSVSIHRYFSIKRHVFGCMHLLKHAELLNLTSPGCYVSLQVK